MRLPDKLLAIDIESTGSDFKIHDICQIGAVLLNKDLSEINRFRTYVKPLTEARDPEAMSIHKIDETLLGKSPELEDALILLEGFVGGLKVSPAAWGVTFDCIFLREQYAKIGRKYPFHYRCLDLKSIVIWELSKHGYSKWSGVESCLKAMGLKFEGSQHDALDDILNVVRMLRIIINERQGALDALQKAIQCL